MEFRLHRDLGEFAALTEAFYGADPVPHTVALTVVAQRLAGDAPSSDGRALLTVHDGGALVGAVSNAIYPRLGYAPVHDAVELHWG